MNQGLFDEIFCTMNIYNLTYAKKVIFDNIYNVPGVELKLRLIFPKEAWDYLSNHVHNYSREFVEEFYDMINFGLFMNTKSFEHNFDAVEFYFKYEELIKKDKFALSIILNQEIFWKDKIILKQFDMFNCGIFFENLNCVLFNCLYSRFKDICEGISLETREMIARKAIEYIDTKQRTLTVKFWYRIIFKEFVEMKNIKEMKFLENKYKKAGIKCY